MHSNLHIIYDICNKLRSFLRYTCYKHEYIILYSFSFYKNLLSLLQKFMCRILNKSVRFVSLCPIYFRQQQMHY